MQKHVISSVETVVSEIKDKKPVKTDNSIFLFYIIIVSAFIPHFHDFCSRAAIRPRTTSETKIFSLQLPVPQKAKQTIILTMNRVSKKSLNAELLL